MNEWIECKLNELNEWQYSSVNADINYIHFVHYQQIKGIAMGAYLGPSVACLTVGIHWEEHAKS